MVRVAIIGGGAGGIATAYLLSKVHHVTLIEREQVLGGNIRTLGRNVSCTSLPPDLFVDAGVIEFERDRFPAFHQLMAELDIELGDVQGASGLHLADGHSFLSPGHSRRMIKNGLERRRALAHLLPLARSRRRFLRSTKALSATTLTGEPLSNFLDESVFSLWMRLLVMYAYSIPAKAVDDAPAALAVPMLRRFLGARRWSRVKGGVYRYIERILERFPGDCQLGAHVRQVRRRSDGVEITMTAGDTQHFDAVVFATTPDQVLKLLGDASEAEARRFAAWDPQIAKTLVHTDNALHRRWKIRYPSEFDLLETANGGYGYNAYLNRLIGLGDHRDTHYQLAFDLEDEINPDRVLHEQHHVTPRYTIEAFRHRDEIIATNGENRTFYAGAYLDDGLHEGAIRSAITVSSLLGGSTLPYTTVAAPEDSG